MDDGFGLCDRIHVLYLSPRDRYGIANVCRLKKLSEYVVSVKEYCVSAARVPLRRSVDAPLDPIIQL